MTHEPPPEASTAPPAVVLLSTWLPADLWVPFDEWCDAHQMALLRVPGVRRARRARFDDGSSGHAPDLLTMYELDDLSIPRSEVWRERAAEVGPLPPVVAERLRSERRDLTVLASLPSPWWPPRPSARFDVFSLTDADRAASIAAAIAAMPTGAPLPLTLRMMGDEDGPPLVLIDHHDDDGDELIDTLTGASGANRSRWTIVFDETAD